MVETITVPGAPFVLDEARAAAVQRALQLLHLIAGVSYYKAGVPETVSIDSYAIDADTAALVETVYLNGLGEFAYRNGLNLRGRFRLPVQGEAVQAPVLGLQPHALVAIGGGKDSLVSIEALRRAGVDETVTWIGGSQLIRACAERTGLPTLNLGRALAPELFELNRQGAWNGHIPVTAVNSAIMVLAALLQGVDQVVFSNERSASYGSQIPGTGEPCAGARCRGPALLLAAAADVGAGGGPPVRQDRFLRRALFQLQPQLPYPRRAPGEPLVRRLPEVPLRVPGAGPVHAQDAPGAHLRPQPAG
ncbi:hypothetical protein G6F68_011918 [Rhizopus microsporus]|nr:hypothetical protein G6F68_011918 [Rhizopus microsporus]